jgi:hypothetical protein
MSDKIFINKPQVNQDNDSDIVEIDDENKEFIINHSHEYVDIHCSVKDEDKGKKIKIIIKLKR